MENLIVSVNCVTPIFLTLLIGCYIRQRGIVPEETFGHISSVCFHVLLPLMMFSNVYAADLSAAFSPPLIAYLLLETAAVFLIAFALVSKTVADRRRRGTYIQNAFRSNIAVVGVSLAQILMDSAGAASMAMAITVLVPVYNALAVITLEACRGGRADWGKTARSILKNPMILGALAGAACLLLNIRLPEPVRSTAAGVGRAGSVMTLVALGASFQFSGLRKNAGRLAACCAVRLIAAPLAALGAAAALGFRGNALSVVLICTATPMATTVFPMAQVYDSDYELAAQQIVVSSVLCCFTMFLWIFALKQLGLI